MTKKVLINAGHGERKNGPYDPGAIGLDGLQEAVQNREVAAIVKKELDGNGWETRTIQSGDLDVITDFAEDWQPDVVLSLHTNSAADPRAKGVETLCHAFGFQGEKIARAIQAELVTATGLLDRGIKARPELYIFRKTRMPSVLVETGFISNQVENKLMRDPAFDLAAGQAIAKGLSVGMGVPYRQITAARKTVGIWYLGQDDWTGAKRVAAKVGAEDPIPRGKYQEGQFDWDIFVGGPASAPGTNKKTFLCGADWEGTMEKVIQFLKGEII